MAKAKGVPQIGLHGKGVARTKSNQIAATTNPTDIIYHGGPCMQISVAYVIWYGSWSGNTGVSIIENFLKYIGLRPWWGITKAYNQSSSIVFGKSTNDNYSQGSNLTQLEIWAIVQRAINLRNLPKDVNGIYFVLTSADVNCYLFCVADCGWHSYDPETNLKYAFVGNADRCPSVCALQTTTSPNNNVGADAMVSIIAHEASEVVTDPYFNAWYDLFGEENADKCAWTFGTLYTASNGAYYNMIVNGKKYLVQQNWRLPTQNCGMS